MIKCLVPLLAFKFITGGPSHEEIREINKEEKIVVTI